VNQLALLCAVPTAFGGYLDALLIDERGDRQGFPQEVADELYRLRTFCESATCPTRDVCDVVNVAPNRTSETDQPQANIVLAPSLLSAVPLAATSNLCRLRKNIQHNSRICRKVFV